MSEESDYVLRAPFNVLREFSARMGTMENGMRVIILQVRFDTLPEETAGEVTLLLDQDMASKLEVRLAELSERAPPGRH